MSACYSILMSAVKYKKTVYLVPFLQGQNYHFETSSDFFSYNKIERKKYIDSTNDSSSNEIDFLPPRTVQ